MGEEGTFMSNCQNEATRHHGRRCTLWTWIQGREGRPCRWGMALVKRMMASHQQQSEDQTGQRFRIE
jgi:hypothetical protein